MNPNTPNLRSGIQTWFKKDFQLDEDGIRRIEGVLAAEIKTHPTPAIIVFHVQRSDDRFYETTNLDDVLNDPNVSDQSIRYCAIEVRENDPSAPAKPWERDWIVRIGFEKAGKNKVMCRISTQDRTWALRLADQLEPQIERTFKSHKTSDLWIIVFVLVVAFLLDNLVSHSVLTSKLPHSLASWLPTVIWIVCVFFGLAIVSDRPSWVIKYFGPESAFLWGDEASSFIQRNETRKNIFWVTTVPLRF